MTEDQKRDKVLDLIGHNTETRITVIPCKRCAKKGNDGYSVVCVGEDVAKSYTTDVFDDCKDDKIIIKPYSEGE